MLLFLTNIKLRGLAETMLVLPDPDAKSIAKLFSAVYVCWFSGTEQ